MVTWQKTFAKKARCHGIALHSGVDTAVVMRPAPADSGIVFRRVDLPGRPKIAARFDSVRETMLCTGIADAAAASVATIEHLMAALAGFGIDNAVIEVDGPELPVMDGSSRDFVAAIDRAGVIEQSVPRRHLKILRPVEVIDGNKYAALLPGDGFELDVTIDFDSAAIGRQSIACTIDRDGFRRELAAARTFGFAHEVDAMRAAGLARGGSLDNAVVIGDDGVLNPGGLRWRDEFVRHKALDALGDLYLAGGPIIGRFVGERCGHALLNKLLRQLFADTTAWTWTISPSAQRDRAADRAFSAAIAAA